MVTLTEVEDEHFQSTQPGPDAEDDDFTDTGTFFLPRHIKVFKSKRPERRLGSRPI